MWFCTHKHLGKVEDGLQYCDRCGKAFLAPVPKKECPHIWVEKEQPLHIQVTEPSGLKVTKSKVYVLQCLNCGDIKKVQVNANDYLTVQK